MRLTRSTILLLLCHSVAPVSPAGVIDASSDQAGALDAIGKATPEMIASLEESDVIMALDRGWFDAAKALLRLLRTRGDSVAAFTDVRAKATKIRDEAMGVINLMRTGANAEATDVNCAFQWAQRPEFIYLNVKFSSRIDGPVTVLNVDNEKVTLGNNSILFEAIGRQKPKTFRLNLTFHGAILPEQSTWSFASVGRMSFTIAKAVNETWPRLLEGKEKPKNMYAWHDRQSTLDAEVRAEATKRKEQADAEKKAADEAQKKADAKAAKDAPPPPLPPTPPIEPGGKGDTPGTSVKKTKKKKTKKKEEL